MDANNSSPKQGRTPDSRVGKKRRIQNNEKTLSATDVLAPTTMKNAAKCDTSCELRNPVSHQNFERILHFLRGVCLLECLFIPTSPLLGSLLCRPLAFFSWKTSLRRDELNNPPRVCFYRMWCLEALSHLNPCLTRRDVFFKDPTSVSETSSVLGHASKLPHV